MPVPVPVLAEAAGAGTVPATPARKVNYVVACWMGRRRYEDPRHVADRSFFLREHLRRLSELDHALDQVTLVVAVGGDPVAERFAEGARVGDTPVVVLRRQNGGFSYGSWNHAYEAFGEEFTHYVLVEDDYLPCLDHFDRTLVEFADAEGTYVCGLSAWDGTHAAISNGVVPTAAWRHVHPAPTHLHGDLAQTVWSRSFHAAGFPVRDWLATHSSPFSRAGARLRWYGHPSLPPLFAPVQALRAPVVVSDGTSRLRACLDAYGRVSPADPASAEVWRAMLETEPSDPRWRVLDPVRWRIRRARVPRWVRAHQGLG